MQNEERIWQLVDTRRPDYEGLADRIWDAPEIAYNEYKSCDEHTQMLEQEGFRVTQNLAGIPTAVMGEAGDGGPVIAILGEYDALPGLSQEAGLAEPKPRPGDGMGHGCGHNLLGTGSLAAAIAVKEWLQAGHSGTLRYYGPAHTDGDISVTFTDADILHAGDTYWNGIYPFIDYSTGGSIDGTIRATDANLMATTDRTVIIPGHGQPVSNRAELRNYRDMLVAIRRTSPRSSDKDARWPRPSRRNQLQLTTRSGVSS